MGREEKRKMIEHCIFEENMAKSRKDYFEAVKVLERFPLQIIIA